MIWTSRVHPQRSPLYRDVYTKGPRVSVCQPWPSFLFLIESIRKEAFRSISVSSEPCHVPIISYQPQSPTRQAPARTSEMAFQVPILDRVYFMPAAHHTERLMSDCVVSPQAVFRNYLGRAFSEPSSTHQKTFRLGTLSESFRSPPSSYWSMAFHF